MRGATNGVVWKESLARLAVLHKWSGSDLELQGAYTARRTFFLIVAPKKRISEYGAAPPDIYGETLEGYAVAVRQDCRVEA